MHINHFWTILLQNPELNILKASKDPTRAKNTITRLILSTDMSFHNKGLEKLRFLNENKQFNPKMKSDHKWVQLC